ncbi:MAG: glycerol-3-phosphate dehydrogenase, partial [Gammaproteobacteria bacterium]|nr:glycerol-3-phosphate dehydrogenase [Gammaproteobacteria bacterium]
MPVEYGKNSALVIGAGSWGTALALVLAKNGQHVYLWDNDVQHIQNLIDHSSNQRYLPGIQLPKNIIPVKNFPGTDEDILNIIIVVPCEYLEDVLIKLKQECSGDVKLCLASKG